MQEEEPLRIAVIGAGIGGLTAALFLQKQGHQISIYEASSKIANQGAGIVVSPNCTRLLGQLGILDRVEKTACLPEKLLLRRYENGAILSETHVLSHVKQTYGSV